MKQNEWKQVIDKITNTYSYLRNSKEKESIIKSYVVELKDYELNDILQAIDNLSKTNRFAPSVAEIKIEINQDTGNVNWNSCYWFEIEREYCEKHNIPYYDINTGKPLPPFKD